MPYFHSRNGVVVRAADTSDAALRLAKRIAVERYGRRGYPASIKFLGVNPDGSESFLSFVGVDVNRGCTGGEVCIEVFDGRPATEAKA